MIPNINLLIKPASSSCNMKCKYCFYADEAKIRSIASYGIMSFDTLETITEKTLAYVNKTCTFAFQGGEPTLAGLEFFQKVIDFQKKYNINNVTIYNSIQTNGMLIDDNFAAFFKENNFLVGVSLDGPKEIHDRCRLSHSNKGSFINVMNGIRVLKKYKVDFNILTVVTEQSAKSAGKIYSFFKKQDFNYQQYIPCLDPLEEERGNYFYSLAPKGYGEFLKSLFDWWYQDMSRGNYTYIRYFENLAAMVKGYLPESCGMNGICGEQWVIEADGSVYPCDFYVLDHWKLGNLVTDSINEINQKRKEIEFIEMSKQKHPDCLSCKWYSLCKGGCRRDRDYKSILEKNYYCKSYYEFYEYAIERLKELLKLYNI